MSLTVSNFFQYYIFFPADAPTEKERWTLLITSIALGILTAGFLHFIAAVATYNRNFQPVLEPDGVDQKTGEVFDKTVNNKEGGEPAKPDGFTNKSAAEIENLLKSGVKASVWQDIIEREANQGKPEFQYLLGKLYKYGEAGVEKSEALSFGWFEKAADAGHAKAAFHLAAMFHAGKGCDKSLEKAAKYYQASAEGGDPRAQFTLGSFCQNGTGGLVKSAEKAAKWYKKSALQNNDKAMNNLGVLYYNGDGVKESLERAMFWFKKSKALGNLFAAQNLEAIIKAEGLQEEEWTK